MCELSVLMCTYNSEEYIAETINSVLNQTFGDFEFIIIDDGSTDATEEVVSEINDIRIKYYKLEKNVGIGKATNYGLTKVGGKYIARIDSDDIYDETRFQKQKNFLDKNQDICIVGTLIDYFCDDENNSRYKYCKKYIENQTNSIFTPEQMHEKLFWYCCLVNSSIMGRTEVIKKYGYGNYRIGEDYKLFYELNKLGYKITNINDVLCRIRISNKSICSKNTLDVYEILYEIKKEEIIRLFNSDKRGVYIWGAGGLGKSLYQIFTQNGLKIEGFLDKVEEKWSETFFDKAVQSPYRILNQNKIAKVIVASEPGRFEITNYLKNIGYINLIDYIVF